MKEKKIKECVRPYMHGCKGCEFNEVPELSDGGCLLLKEKHDQKEEANNETGK